MARRKSASARRAQRQSRGAALKIGLVAGLVIAMVVAVVLASRAHRDLDAETLCPTDPASDTVLLVDVTDPMNVAQRQDFLNQLERLKNTIPRYGRLTVVKVDSTADRLLQPVIVRCNPGIAADVSAVSGNPKAVQAQHDTGFSQALDRAFESLVRASGAETSPILESVQSVALTQFQAHGNERRPRRLIIASDLLQNTREASFYRSLPDADQFLASPAFRTARTDLGGVEVELWMLQRPDSGETQPRALPDLWTRIIEAQGGTVIRVYRVSG